VATQELRTRVVADWLDRGAPPARTPQDVLLHLVHRIAGIGIPVHRVAVFVRTLHPNVAGRAFIWNAKTDLVEVSSADHGIQETAQFLESPVRVVYEKHVEVRRRICDSDCPLDFPIVADLRAEGATDFLALPLRFLNGDVHAASFTTGHPGGFTEPQVAALRRLMPPFSRLAEIYSLRRMSQNILDAYLGRHAGEKVLAGQIKRGDGEEIRAVIWFCDLRDSTPLADSMSREDFLRLLNEYFECVLGPVQERGGEILRFIGDAALAIFPIGNEPAAVACANALAAARESVTRMAKLNAARERPLGFGIGLHLGIVLHGNIGTSSRIEFTVIGAAANEAARIESLCKTLQADLLVSETVARHLGEPLRSLGRHKLRGVGGEIELFAPGAAAR
jgi:adenylate cyclase